MAEIQGSCEARFDGVRRALVASLDAATDVGASVAVYLHGDPVVDIWGGFTDETRTSAWGSRHVDQCLVHYQDHDLLVRPNAGRPGPADFTHRWCATGPSSRKGPKRAIEVRHIMGHTSGLSGWEEPLEHHQLADWERCTTLLAAQVPWWEPGTVSGYHALTQGYLIGEIVRRIDG